jgi:hypothetical protein
MVNARNAQTFLTAELKRSLGRPRRRREDNIKVDFKKVEREA